MWESLGFRLPRAQENAGSIPATLTLLRLRPEATDLRGQKIAFTFLKPQVSRLKPEMRWCSCWYGQAPVKRTGAGSIPASAAFNGRASRLATAAVSKTVERRALRVRLPLLPLVVPLADRHEAPAFQAG